MTRQGVTQHLVLLEAANVVATVRRGREKLHFLNPVPLQEIYERSIAKFEKPRLKALWFGTHCESQWTPGSPWKMLYPDGTITDAGEIVESEPPRRLVIRWQHQNKPELKAEGESLCTMELEPSGTAVKLSITHTIEREPSKLIAAVSGGWPKIISNLKSLLETGSTVLALMPMPGHQG
jgi:uncharacterized protein YndB with AHSA1/START domain